MIMMTIIIMLHREFVVFVHSSRWKNAGRAQQKTVSKIVNEEKASTRGSPENLCSLQERETRQGVNFTRQQTLKEETIMATNEECVPSAFASVAASEWFLPAVGEFLAITDLARLLFVNKDCHKAILAWLPVTTLALIKVTLPAQVLVFGVHGCCNMNDEGLYRSPTPITFDSHLMHWVLTPRQTN